MKKNPALPLSLSIVVLLIAQQMLTLHTPAQTLPAVEMLRRSARAFGDGILAKTNIVENTVAARTLDAVELGYDHPPFEAGERIPVFRMRALIITRIRKYRESRYASRAAASQGPFGI